MKKLLVIPNDPLERYVAKGEVKPRYFNPCNLFDEIAVISLANSDRGTPAAITMAGDAEVSLKALGNVSCPRSLAMIKKRALELVKEFRPQVIRAYNPLFMGYLAVWLAEQTGAKSVISVHDDYDLGRSLNIYGLPYLKSKRGIYQILQKLTGWERWMFKNADRVICAYKFTSHYVSKFRGADTELIYNRVDLKRFSPAENQEFDGTLKIINVGRQFEGKNPAPIVEAVAGLPFTRLTLVGDGPYHDRLVKLVDSLGIGDRVEFRTRVTNDELAGVYRNHHVFAINMIQPGVCIPMLEASACGLASVCNVPRWEKAPEVVGTLAELVPPTAEGYSAAFRKLAEDSAYRTSRAAEIRRNVLQYDGEEMERREAALYEELIVGGQNDR